MKLETLEDVKLIMEGLLWGYRDIYTPNIDILQKTEGKIRDLLLSLAAFDKDEKYVHLEIAKKGTDPYLQLPTLHLWRATYWRQIQRSQEVMHEEVVAGYNKELQKRAKIEILCRKIRRHLKVPLTDTKENFSRVIASDAVINGNVAILKVYGIEFDITEDLENPEEYL